MLRYHDLVQLDETHKPQHPHALLPDRPRVRVALDVHLTRSTKPLRHCIPDDRPGVNAAFHQSIRESLRAWSLRHDLAKGLVESL
jgi:hypothetical protein